MARKSEYSQKVADRIIELAAGGMSLTECAQVKGIPSRTTIYKWLDQNEGFADAYARAREIRADRIAEEVIEIADKEMDPQKARNRIDARKWAASKMYPKQYGDRQIIQGTGDKEDAIHVESTNGALEQIISRLSGLADKSAADGDPGADQG